MTTTAVRPDNGVAAPQRPPRRKVRGLLAKHWYAWLMIAPVVLVISVLVLYPLARGIYLSLTNATEMNVGRTIGANEIPATYDLIGLDNYLDVLSGADGAFYPRLLWTIQWTVICVTLHFTLGLGLAMLLNRAMRLRTLYRMLLILPWAVPPFVAAFGWRLILNDQGGVLNAVLGAVGISGVDWLGQPLAAKVSVIMVNVWLGVPFMMVALLGGLQTIPKELYEAAEMDGATPWQRFRAVTMPGLRPVSGTVVLLGTIWTFNQFPVIALLTGGGPGGSTNILVTEAYERAFQGIRDYAGAATYGAVIASMLVVFAFFYQRWLRRQSAEVLT
ncbi:ABC transporter permease [Prauserella marina]|uniref:Arabinogalactan oligomer / maltooligosaccharide transport system permease protein n=1 Tax=Prauserella marina TaxID=530584 RepID=A0A222VY16_9PSEU|nr:sugar ABC transporter permease [Prauserella marina]ASR38573.1 ABC transporter permease [Prauserella marina]PWV81891.1 arabinogalactan oligomer/maltooligosaccharide transport system permease protein [Prauserella marina]SDD14726.1 arabinogalactan oligomer / maltooligosaccharide transport system permease protein [Prauserella marina]